MQCCTPAVNKVLDTPFAKVHEVTKHKERQLYTIHVLCGVINVLRDLDFHQLSTFDEITFVDGDLFLFSF